MTAAPVHILLCLSDGNSACTHGARRRKLETARVEARAIWFELNSRAVRKVTCRRSLTGILGAHHFESVQGVWGRLDQAVAALTD